MTNAVVATTPKEKHLLNLALRRGLSVLPVGTQGAVRIIGREVDVMASRLFWIEPRDITPHHPKKP